MSLSDEIQPYAGRWVALVQGRVVGVGASAEDARANAQLSRHKERPQVMFVTEPFEFELPELLAEVQRLAPNPAAVWLVGGAVRDVMLHRRLHDLDFAVEGDGLAVARTVANAQNAAFYPLDDERGVGRVILTRDEHTLTLDFARLRGADLHADLAARDFTLNAMAVTLTEPPQLIDPLRGQADLRAKIIRACGPNSISDDPIRGVRAVRQAAQLNFRLDKGTRAAIREQAGALAHVSAERVRDEFIRCIGGPRPAASLRALDLLGLLEHIAPEALAMKGVTQSEPHVLDVWEHTLAVIERLDSLISILGPIHDVDAASELTLGLIAVQLGRYRRAISDHLRAPLSSERPTRWTLMLAALLHDVAKPQTRSVDPDGRIRFFTHEELGAKLTEDVMTRLRFSTDEIKHARVIVANHMRPRQLRQMGAPSRRAIYKFFRDTGAAGVDTVLLALADYLGKFGGSPPPQDEWAEHVAGCAKLLEAYFEKREEQVAPPALLTGHDLIEQFGLQPGPQIGQLLEAIREAQAAGEITNREAALEFVRRQLKVNGAGPHK